MPKQITVDVSDATVTVTLRKESGSIIISGDYTITGGGFTQSTGRVFSPNDFTPAQRTALQTAYDIVVAKCRSVEGV